MLLEADTLVYDYDNNTVIAVGGVRIDYAGNRLVAQRVTYYRDTGRLVASGNVQMIDVDGTIIYSDEVDITDDFANGFVNALRVETVDKTYFAAESGERKDGLVTTFNNGVYTACEPCEEKPDKAPIWRVKARKIIWDSKAKTVRFERSRFEMFGFPIAYLPFFEVADPTVKRKTGFLMPGISFGSELGMGGTIPFYIALAPTYDLTLYSSYFANQGFLGQAEWRQRFNSGEYSIRIAGIRQNDPSDFTFGGVNAGTLADPNRLRGMVGSKGRFRINPRWTFGWDIMAQTDKNFAYTYKVGGYSDYVHRSQIFLTGLNGRNYFDLHAYRFQVQEDLPGGHASARNELQPVVLPTVDYARIADNPVAGGELSIKVNAQNLRRETIDASLATPVVRGISGSTGRLTAEAEWKKSVITDGGLVVTPMLHVRGDAIYASLDPASVTAINQMATSRGVLADLRSTYSRFMATAGLELRWPVLFSMTGSSHVVEPITQVFARPSEAFAGRLGVPNEDAQSFVFDATTLFERDKFSGYDRVEGGTRVNVGLRYTGTFLNGWTANAIVGQSYHIGGNNSFASPDLVNAGAFSGLETPKSDYVALVGFSAPRGFSASVSGRFDEQTGQVRRAEAKAGTTIRNVSLTGNYAFIQAQPLYGFANDRHEATIGASARLHENWRVFGSATYDFQSGVVINDSIGFAYDDECFSYSMTFAESRNRLTREVDQTVGFTLSFRTIGDFGTSSLGGSAFQ
ncbi:MAG: LPS-assembly protein LptD [Rhizobiaceae bacterium]